MSHQFRAFKPDLSLKQQRRSTNLLSPTKKCKSGTCPFCGSVNTHIQTRHISVETPSTPVDGEAVHSLRSDSRNRKHKKWQTTPIQFNDIFGPIDCRDIQIIEVVSKRVFNQMPSDFALLFPTSMQEMESSGLPIATSPAWEISKTSGSPETTCTWRNWPAFLIKRFKVHQAGTK